MWKWIVGGAIGYALLKSGSGAAKPTTSAPTTGDDWQPSPQLSFRLPDGSFVISDDPNFLSKAVPGTVMVGRP